MKSIIISAFPGTGKTWLTENVKQFSAEVPTQSGLSMELFKYHDSDNSKFSWIYDAEGNKTDQRNPDFPSNYMEHIRSLMEEDGNIIFVSSHESVREALVEAGFHFYIARPAMHLKDLYLKKYKERGNDEKFIDLIDKNWNIWISDIDKFHNMHMDTVTLIELRKNVYLQQAINYVIKEAFPTSISHIILYPNILEQEQGIADALKKYQLKEKENKNENIFK